MPRTELAHPSRPFTLWQHPRLACAALAFVVTLVFGGLGGLLVIDALNASAARAMRDETQAFGVSVARAVAAQYARAGLYEIALDRVPGTEAYLSRVLRDTPGVVAIELLDAAGQPLASIGERAALNDETVDAPISVGAQTLGQVRVVIAPSRFADTAPLAHWAYPLTALALALGAAALVWWRAGADLERRRQRLLVSLQAGLDGAPGWSQAGAPAHATGSTQADALDAALGALADGDAALRAQRLAFEALAQEILAVDFDGRMAAGIAAIRQRAGPVLDPSDTLIREAGDAAA